MAKRRGEYVAPSLGRVTVGEVAAEWLERKQQATAPSHHRMLESAWRVHVAPRWASVSVADVDAAQRRGLGRRPWSPRAVPVPPRCCGPTVCCRGILSDAVKARRLAVNPAKGVENLPRKTAKRHVYLSAR